MKMKQAKKMVTMLALWAALAAPIALQAFERGKVERFATLPPGEAHPEGICLGPEGNVYVVTVAANKPKGSPGTLLVFDPNGKHLRTVHIAGSSRMLLDLRFHPKNGKLIVIDYEEPKVLAVDPQTGASSVFMTITGDHPGLDGLTFDNAGNLWPSAGAHEGMIWKVRTGRRRGARSGSRANSSSQQGHRPRSAQMALRSTTTRRRCSFPTPHKTRSLKSR